MSTPVMAARVNSPPQRSRFIQADDYVSWGAARAQNAASCGQQAE
ncbi:hypothetical protein ACFOGG_08370 [Brenneria rubrifaciens]